MRRSLPSLDFSAFGKGFLMPLRGAAFLVKNRGLKRYAVLPLMMNLVLYAAAISVFFYFLWRWEIGTAAWEFWGPVGGWLAAAFNWMGWMLKFVAAMVGLAAAFFTFTGVGMVLASPLNDILSEKAEVVYFGSEKQLDLPLRFTIAASLISIGDSLRNLIKQIVCSVVTLPFLLIPVVGFLPLFMVNAYFAGFGFLDSAMARNFLRPPHKKLISRRRFWEIVGFGTAMQIIFTIPFLGIVLMPVGVAAGTLIYCTEDWEALLAEAGMPHPRGFVPGKKAAVS